MAILLGFAPFILFVIVEQAVGVNAGLISAAIVALALVAREALHGRRLKVLELGTTILFGGLAIYAWVAGGTWTVFGVRLAVDAGLFLIVLISIAIGLPFTLPYARERVPPEAWERPEFIRTNYIVTTAWAVAFAVIVAADALLLYAPQVPAAVGIAVTVLALLGAIRFTTWYPARVRARVIGS
jgi:hypothetical protein